MSKYFKCLEQAELDRKQKDLEYLEYRQLRRQELVDMCNILKSKHLPVSQLDQYRELIIKLDADGLGSREIAAQVGVDRSTISRYLQKIRAEK